MNDKLDVAQTILAQLGGRRFLAMTGAANLTGHPDKLTMKLGRNSSGGGHMEIQLVNDTYTVTIERIRMLRKGFRLERTVVASESGVYAESLQDVFTKLTGLYTSLGTTGKQA